MGAFYNKFKLTLSDPKGFFGGRGGGKWEWSMEEDFKRHFENLTFYLIE